MAFLQSPLGNRDWVPRGEWQDWKAISASSFSGSTTGEHLWMSRGADRNYLLALLSIILLFNYVDRLALGIVLQDIKLDLELSDTQLGFLTGIAFAFFYSIMGVPIAR